MLQKKIGYFLLVLSMAILVACGTENANSQQESSSVEDVEKSATMESTEESEIESEIKNTEEETAALEDSEETETVITESEQKSDDVPTEFESSSSEIESSETESSETESSETESSETEPIETEPIESEIPEEPTEDDKATATISKEERITPLTVDKLLASNINLKKWIYMHGNLLEANVIDSIKDDCKTLHKYYEGDETYAIGLIDEYYLIDIDGTVGYSTIQGFSQHRLKLGEEIGSVSWTGDGVTLEALNMTIPTLAEYNWQAMAGQSSENLWTGDPNDTETFGVLMDTLDGVRAGLVNAGVLNERTGQAFCYNGYEISFDWASYSSTHDFSLYRDPHRSGTYTLYFSANLIEDIFGGKDFAPYNRDVLMTMCTLFSSTPQEVYDYIYKLIYVDSSEGHVRDFVAVGDCAIRFAGEESWVSSGGSYTFEFEIRQFPTEKKQASGPKNELATTGTNTMTLENLYFNWPLLDYFNNQGLEKNAGWFGNRNHADYDSVQKKRFDNLAAIGTKLQLYKYMDKSDIGFVVSDKTIKWYWDGQSGDPYFIIERVPEEGIYRVTLNCSIQNDRIDALTNRGPFNREILMAMLSMISSTPEEVFNYIYLGICWDSERLNSESYVNVGDCAIRYDEDVSEYYHWVYEIKEQ